MVAWYWLLIIGIVCLGLGYGFRGFIRRKLGWIEKKVGNIT